MPVPHSFIPYLGGSKQLVPRSMFLNPMPVNLQVAMGGLVLHLHKPAPPTPPEMAAAITGEILPMVHFARCNHWSSCYLGQIMSST
jgi:hypothetical protein